MTMIGTTTLHTPLCDLLGIDYPLLQAPMATVATVDLVAAVSDAGGIGILPGVMAPPEHLRRQIREVRSKTDRPFGVNLLLHRDFMPPVDPSGVPEPTVRAVQSTLNGFRRRLGLAEVMSAPPALPDFVEGAFTVIVEERVPIFSTGLGIPSMEMVNRCHGQGIRVVAQVATVDDARRAVANGVDVIVAQGSEAGGHRMTGEKAPDKEFAAIGTLALTPQVVEAVDVPVVAAGGIVNGRGLAAVLMLGAVGGMAGTRFIACAESGAPPFHKDALLQFDGDATVLSDAFTGLYARCLRNTYSDEYEMAGSPVMPGGVQLAAAMDIAAAAAAKGNPEYYALYAGQGVGLIHDLPPAAEIVRSMVEQAAAAIAALPAAAGLAASAGAR
jgi:nitronate monooxygenase